MRELIEEELVDSLDLEEPDTVIGEAVCFQGQLQFQRLLRIDGQFEGELTSGGSLIVGPKAMVRANLQLRAARIEGQVTGNIRVEERLELRSGCKVTGQISAPQLVVEEGAQIDGQVKVG
jgi:cytoskeletal protein CcmA (bactofilin family)